MTSPLVIGSIRTPASLGLSTEDPSVATDQNVALTLVNAAYDNQGRVCARKGWDSLTDTGGHAASTDSIHEYVKDNTTKHIVSAAGGALYSGTTTLTDITGALTPGDDDWVFVNFNGKVLGFQSGETPITWSGTSNFANITASAGVLPTGGIALSAFGRVWATDANDSAVKFCASLDETDWGGAGAGSIDFTEIWPDGLDKVVGIAEWQNRIVFFGERSALVYDNPVDPTLSAFALSDVINVGCVSHKSIAAVANDLLFLSVDGLHSLQRAIAYENIPQASLALGVRTDLTEAIAQVITAPETIQCAYSRVDGFYLARIGNVYWHFDVKLGSARASEWRGIGFKSLCAATDGTLYFGQTGVVGSYGTYLDDASTYWWEYRSAFLDLAEGREVYPKTASVTAITTGNYTVNFLAAYDYVGEAETATYTLPITRTISEWQTVDTATTSVHEWGTAEWSGSASTVTRMPFDVSGAGNRVQMGISVEINGHAFCVQRIDLTSRLGRIAA